MTHCKNCDTPLESSFCPHCGQKDIELERPLSELLAQVIREAFDIDGRAARTVWTLFRRPGVLTSEFLAGHRRSYTPPFRLYLVISVLFFVVIAQIAGRGILLNEDQTIATDASEQARFLGEDLPKLMFVLLPVYALLLKTAFRGRFYFDHLIHSLHLHSAAYAVLALSLPFEEVAGRHWPLLVVQLILLAYLVAYFGISYRHVYGASWRVAGTKAAVVFFAYLIVLAGSFEVLSYLTMPESMSVPYLTD